MADGADQIEVYIESGESKTFAVSLDWPGWCRSGRDEAAALEALFSYGPRYARVLENSTLGFRTPTEETTLVVVERLTGTTTTNFGAPDRILDRDWAPVEPAELQRFEDVMRACWRAVDGVAKAAAGRELAKGPRGGGRDLDKMMEHIQGGDDSYLTALGGKAPRGSDWAGIRAALLDTLAASVRGEIPAQGPRGGVRWPARYFVRRLAWHELDHVWEIEDRSR